MKKLQHDGVMPMVLPASILFLSGLVRGKGIKEIGYVIIDLSAIFERITLPAYGCLRIEGGACLQLVGYYLTDFIIGVSGKERAFLPACG